MPPQTCVVDPPSTSNARGLGGALQRRAVAQATVVATTVQTTGGITARTALIAITHAAGAISTMVVMLAPMVAVRYAANASKLPANARGVRVEAASAKTVVVKLAVKAVQPACSC